MPESYSPSTSWQSGPFAIPIDHESFSKTTFIDPIIKKLLDRTENLNSRTASQLLVSAFNGWHGDNTNDDHAAVMSAFTSVASSGGEIVFPDGPVSAIASSLDFTSATRPVRVRFGAGGLRAIGSSNFPLIKANQNVRIEGLLAGQTIFTPKAGQAAIQLTGTWQTVVEGYPAFQCRNIGFSGGASAINASGVVGLNEGLFWVDACVVNGTTAQAIILPDSLYYSKVSNTQFVACYTNLRIGQNTETIIEDSVFKASASGGPTIELQGPHHVRFRGCQLYGQPPNTNADMLIVAVTDLTSGYTYIEGGCKFGGERETWLHNARNRIKVYNVANPGYTATRLVIRDDEFLGPGLLSLISIGRVDSTDTSTATAQCSGSYGHGLQVGDKILIEQVTDSSFNGEHTVTAVGTAGTTQTFSWADTTASDVAQSNRVGFVASLSTSAIELASPIADSDIDDCLFSNFGYAVDDSFTENESFRDLSGRNKWGDGNRVRGPLGRGGIAFKNGGRSFSSIKDPNGTTSIRRVFVEPVEIRNRLPDSETLNNWPKLGGITWVTGQTDPWGTTRATKMVRSGSAAFQQQSSGVYGLTEGAARTIDTTGMGLVSYFKFWGKAGTVSTASICFLDSTNSAFFINQPLTPNWEFYCYRIAFGTLPLQFNITPGGTDPEPGTIYLCAFQLDDWNGPYVPTGASAVVDSTSGVRLERNLVLGPSSKIIGDTANASPITLVNQSLEVANIAMSDGVNTASAAQYKCRVLLLTGSLTANRQLLLPGTPGFFWYIYNGCNNSVSVLDAGGHAGVNIAAGHSGIAFAVNANALGGVTS